LGKFQLSPELAEFSLPDGVVGMFDVVVHIGKDLGVGI
jgi:hypothetical protein